MRSTRTKLAIALLVIATIGATSAMASDGQFIDVPKEGAGSFAHDPAEWAAANGLTTGCNSPGGGVIGDNFCPDSNVTRGQNITFTYRHHTELIEPLLAAIESDVAENAAAAAAAQADIAALPTEFWVTLATDGSIASSSPGIDTDPTVTGRNGEGAGDYKVGFVPDISVEDCFATVSLANTTLTDAEGIAADFPNFVMAIHAGDEGSIQVATFDLDGLADMSFTLRLSCPAGVAPGPGFGNPD